MIRHLAILAVLPMPAFAASGPFFSLNNTDFVVSLGFLIFLGVLLYYKVPRTVFSMLDNRAESIRKDLAEARELREEAQTLLASYERKQKDVQNQADRIVASARDEARANADKAKADLQTSVDRRLAAARDQIQSAEDQAVRDVRNRAVRVAVEAAREALREQSDAERQNRLIDQAIETVGAKLH
ncbi:F0F1 ATP synthase subunit B [Palleronia sediminis]|uniref:ATP synthase subunit b n=1 Tax=Palleronia sediminis TaxID=2547833 RepID=A0A4R6AFK5_9RHOB|nr:F0F1 ATP synthase subunit B [Palleronia sediminis]TDL81882.1 F0F1 ATP synthase subunit B [Palleronia sediminis]